MSKEIGHLSTVVHFNGAEAGWGGEWDIITPLGWRMGP